VSGKLQGRLQVNKIDLKKQLKHLYGPGAKNVVEVDVPQMNFLMIDGKGDPNNSKEYTQAVEALFMTSYNLKFMVKKGGMEIDYGVMPLEGLWWADDMASFNADTKADWQWTMMMMQPEFISSKLVEEAIAAVRNKKNPPALPLIRFESLKEGKCAQILHIGPFSEEGPTIAKVHDYIEKQSSLRGKHHEIYLSDIRRAEPAKWKTIIRQPMQ
jgi:hypothetical protein